MHFSWNFIQGVIFPFQGSGSGLNSVYLIKGNDVDMWPEASHYIVLTFFIEIVLIWLLYRKKGCQLRNDGAVG